MWQHWGKIQFGLFKPPRFWQFDRTFLETTTQD
jgi:hypothetical protein